MFDFIEIPSPTVILTLILGLLILFRIISRANKNYPPGPYGLPLVGYAPFMTKRPHEKLNQLSDKYGDVMMVNIMGKTVIHLNSYESIREAFVEKGDSCNGRPQDFSFFNFITDGFGLVQAEGPVWKEHRRFALHTLRDFGFGKLSLEGRVLKITEDLMTILQESKGEPLDIADDLSNCATNVICSMLFDKHFERNDPDFLATRKRVTTLLNTLPGTAFFTGFPLAQYLPLSIFPGMKTLIQIKKEMYEMLDRFIQEHVETFDSENLRDYMDVFLNETKIAEKENRLNESTFTVPRLRGIALNIFMAGTETTATTLHWALKLVMVHQDVQKRIQTELDNVIGQERKPSIIDKSNLPYTEATILEIMRFSSMITIIPVHSNPVECVVGGFVIPERSLILANNWAVTRDPRHYVNPEEFKPSRFLGPDGKVHNRDTLIPFSIGKRSCPGESLARMEVFLVLASILQKFNIVPPEDNYDLSLQPSDLFIRKLPVYNLCAKLR